MQGGHLQTFFEPAKVPSGLPLLTERATVLLHVIDLHRADSPSRGKEVAPTDSEHRAVAKRC
jgi:hypothetical protein